MTEESTLHAFKDVCRRLAIGSRIACDKCTSNEFEWEKGCTGLAGCQVGGTAEQQSTAILDGLAATTIPQGVYCC